MQKTRQNPPIRPTPAGDPGLCSGWAEAQSCPTAQLFLSCRDTRLWDHMGAQTSTAAWPWMAAKATAAVISGHMASRVLAGVGNGAVYSA